MLNDIHHAYFFTSDVYMNIVDIFLIYVYIYMYIYALNS